MLINLTTEELATVQEALERHRKVSHDLIFLEEDRLTELDKIDAALAALARPQGQRGAWVPVEDGFGFDAVTFGGRHVEHIHYTQEWLTVGWRPESGEWYKASIQLPDNLRLCRLTQPAAGTGEGVQAPTINEIIRALEYHYAIAASVDDTYTPAMHAIGMAISELDPLRQRPAAQEGGDV